MNRTKSKRTRIVEIVAMTLAIVGVFFNNEKMGVCFPIWIVSNVLAGYLHWRVGYRWMLTGDAVFIVLAIVGWIKWS